jgi:aspartyl-tRNA(Asn)/glutamyl-tRNA(Gln) amidotransferase subunit A
LNDLYVNTRTEALGLETKLAAVMGAMALSQDQYVPYYEKAMKIRRLIKNSLRFDEYDVIVLPTAIGENPYENLSLFALAPLAGLPSISFSYQGEGIQLIANAKNENALITAWEAIQ